MIQPVALEVEITVSLFPVDVSTSFFFPPPPLKSSFSSFTKGASTTIVKTKASTKLMIRSVTYR